MYFYFNFFYIIVFKFMANILLFNQYLLKMDGILFQTVLFEEIIHLHL